MSYCIGSLNLRGGKKATKHQRDFYEILYRIITGEDFVLFAFQEDATVRSNSVIDDLLGTGATALSQRGWDGFHMPGPDKSSEFSFIWDSTRVQPCTIPGIFNTVKMCRSPLCGNFAVISEGSRFAFPYEFRLINIHLVHERSCSPKNLGLKGKEARKLECEHVKNDIYENIQSHIPEDGIRHIFTVALGDYNLNCEDSNQCLPSRIKTFQSENTTLNINGDYCNSYDHFSFDIIHNETVENKSMRINVLKYCESIEHYRGNVSDHVPIKLEIF